MRVGERGLDGGAVVVHGMVVRGRYLQGLPGRIDGVGWLALRCWFGMGFGGMV